MLHDIKTTPSSSDTGGSKGERQVKQLLAFAKSEQEQELTTMGIKRESCESTRSMFEEFVKTEVNSKYLR